MLKGKVKWFDPKKGYGFITPEDGSDDVFVHHSGIVMNGYKTLDDGATVEFETETGKRGLKAINVKVAA